MVVDLVEEGSDDELVIVSGGSVNSGGKIVNSLFRSLFFVEFVLGVDASFVGRDSELFKEVIGQIVSVFELSLSESKNYM